MIVDRYRLIGIKQIIRLEWLRETANLLLAGLEPHDIRKELHEYLQNDKLYNSLNKERSSKTRTFAVTNLMRIWVVPDVDLNSYRDASLDYIRQNPDMDFAIHWGMVCAAYPFWFNIARQTGRLLALQNRITSAQVTNRLKELYGDRTTIIRNTGYVLSAFMAWRALQDTSAKGCYEGVPRKTIADPHLAILLLEAALLAMPEDKVSLNQLVHCPAFFPFSLPPITSEFISRNSIRIETVLYGTEEVLLRLI